MGEFYGFKMVGGGFVAFTIGILSLSVRWEPRNGWERNIRMNAVIVCVAQLYRWPPLGGAGRSTTLTGPTENTT